MNIVTKCVGTPSYLSSQNLLGTKIFVCGLKIFHGGHGKSLGGEPDGECADDKEACLKVREAG